MAKFALAVSEKAGSVDLKIDEGENASACLILAHGAGAGMDHSFMKSLAHHISKKGIHVIRFNFPYKQKGKKMPGSPKESVLTMEKVVQFAKSKFPDHALILSGKSYGGRMGSHLVAEQPDLGVKGLIYFGFPLHAPGRNSKDRASHLSLIAIPQLFLQGTRDALADIQLIREVVLDQQNAKLVQFEQADHSFKASRDAPFNTKEIFDQLVEESVRWIQELV